MQRWTSVTLAEGWRIHLAATARGICRIGLGGSDLSFARRLPAREASRRDDKDPLLGEAIRQLAEYLRGKRREFDLPLDLNGTPFQERVWRQLLRIPYGATRSYGELARAVGRPGAARAVGQACGANPVPIVVPCHRVIAAGGALGGYGAGRKLKRRLLDLEKSAPPRNGSGRRARPS
jgi:methylated-DNA-[protein]-cysteine S-methyltransferase